MPNSLTWRPKHSVRVRFTLIQGVLTAFLVVVLAAFLYIPTRRSIENSSNEAYFVLTNNLVATVFNSLAAGDNEAVIAAAKKIEGVEGVSYVLVLDSKDKVIYDTLHTLEGKILNDKVTKKASSVKNVIRAENSRDGTKYYEYAAPFLVNNEPAAIVRIAVAENTITGEFDKIRALFFRISGVILLIGVIVSFIVASRVTEPIRKLTESALAVRAGNLNIEPGIVTNDEMEQLAREFKRMVDQLKIFYLREVREKEKAVEDFKRIQEINMQLEELDRRKNEFLSIASHQLRTPLAIILWTTNMIKEKAMSHLSETEQKMLLETEKNARIMEGLISELLDLSRIERGTQKMSITELDIKAFVQDVFTNFRSLAGQKNITLIFEQGSKPIPKIKSDGRAIRHIISNLTDNAIRYTENGGQVTLRIDAEINKVVIKVSDTGIGMTEEEKKNIFKQFSRGERALHISPDGSGLGLYLVKQMADRLGATIAVESQVGVGTTFTVELPLDSTPYIQNQGEKTTQ